MAESDDQVYGMVKNTEAEYWTVKDYGFTAAQTAVLKPTDRAYISAFMVPAGQAFTDNNAWTIIDGEYYLKVEMCA